MVDDRTRPSRIRITGLQEAQLPDLLALDQACTAMYYDVGFDGAEVPTRSVADFAAMTRDHDVRVAEADHAVAGFLAWRDESPGVAYLADVSVHPDYQRFGIATRLLEDLRDRARNVGLEHIVVRVWEKAAWATSFYARTGFAPIGDDAPPRVLRWREDRLASGRPLTRPGETALWAPIGAATHAEPEPDEDAEPSDV